MPETEHLKKHKSVLDGVPLKETGFPLNKNLAQASEGQADLVIVSYCRQCGAPIYGKAKIKEGEDPCVKKTCECE